MVWGGDNHEHEWGKEGETKMNWIAELEKLNACGEALRWCETQETTQSAWSNCERGDWMLWILGKLAGPPESDSRKALVLTACDCARLALPHVKKGETRPLKAIEAAEAWARGEGGVTLNDVRNAASAAYAASAAAYATVSLAIVAAHCVEIEKGTGCHKLLEMKYWRGPLGWRE